MNNDSRFEIEARAYTGLQELLVKARDVRVDFESAGLDLPAPLARILGEMPANGTAEGEEDPKLTIPPLRAPPHPPDAEPDWIWVDIMELQVQTLMLGILRRSGKPMKPKDIVVEVTEINANFNRGSVYNVGPRLDGSVIVREDRHWGLIDDSKAPVLYQGYAWGPIAVFPKHELAAHRRTVLLHVLKLSTDGLMQMQIVRQLQASHLCKAPLSKDLVKTDIIQLAEAGKVKRIGRTKKWTTAGPPRKGK